MNTNDIDVEQMTLRDYFAAEAMQSMLMTAQMATMGDIARAAYQQADLMLEARK